MRFLCVMTVNIQFNSAVTAGVIQNKMFCKSSKEHLGAARSSAQAISAKLKRVGKWELVLGCEGASDPES